MKPLWILLVLIVVQTICSGCSEEQSPSSTSSSEPPPPPPTLNIVDAQITAVGVPDGGTAQQVRAGEKFTVEGTFRIPGGSQTGPPPVAIRVRNRNNVIADSTAVKSEARDNDEYAFSGEIEKISKPGDYTIEVQVREDVIQSQELTVQP